MRTALSAQLDNFDCRQRNSGAIPRSFSWLSHRGCIIQNCPSIWQMFNACRGSCFNLASAFNVNTSPPRYERSIVPFTHDLRINHVKRRCSNDSRQIRFSSSILPNPYPKCQTLNPYPWRLRSSLSISIHRFVASESKN